MKRYRRQALFDYDKKQWRTFYQNMDGKLVFDRKVTNYKQAREEIKKNQYKKPDDFINKNKSKIASTEINSRVESQREVDRLLRKEKLTRQERRELKELSENAGYKKKKISKKVKQRKKSEDIQKFEMQIPCVYFSSTSTGFYIPAEVYIQIKGLIKKTFKKYKPDRLNVEIDSMQGSMPYSSINDLREFESGIENAISGYGSIPYRKGMSTLKLSIIKR
jgi:hypothetical protein